MVIAYVERQASLIFAKILNNLHNIDQKQILLKSKKPTKHIINLKNGSTIHCYAAGETGWGIMGFTIDLLIADEAAFINEEVWNSITPALAVTKGHIWLLSTPKLKEGFYYNCFTNPNFTPFHQSSEDCPRIPPEFLEEKKRQFTTAQYAQMYLGNFVDDFKQVFSEAWIKQVCTLPPETPSLISGGETYLGVDIAGMGEDESVFSGVQRVEDNVFQVSQKITTKTRTTETEDQIIKLDRAYNYEKVGIDDGGLGVGVFDHLLEHDDLKFKIVGLNNARRIIDKDDKTSKLYKEAMYYNLLAMGERGEIKLFNDDATKRSLRCIQVEENGSISGRYSHVVESVIRAAWLAKAKPLNFKVYSIKV